MYLCFLSPGISTAPLQILEAVGRLQRIAASRTTPLGSWRAEMAPEVGLRISRCRHDRLYGIGYLGPWAVSTTSTQAYNWLAVAGKWPGVYGSHRERSWRRLSSRGLRTGQDRTDGART